MEKGNAISELRRGSRGSCNASFEKKRKAVGLVQPLKVNAKNWLLANRRVAYKENIVLLRFLVKETYY